MNECDKRKKTSSELLVHLRKLERQGATTELIQNVLAIFFGIDVESYHNVVDWLMQSNGWKQAQHMVDNAIRYLCLPLKFKLVSGCGWCLISYTQMVPTPDVPCVTIDGTMEGIVNPTVCCGDIVCLNTISTLLWIVHEIKQQRRTVMLKQLEGKSKGQYREVMAAMLLGATIRRYCISEVGVGRIRKYLNATSSEPSVNSQSQSQTLQQPPIQIIFQLPRPTADCAIAAMTTLVEAQRMAITERQYVTAQEDPIIQVQAQAQFTAWTEHKDAIARAKLILQELDTSCFIHDHFRQILCRALKCLSRGHLESQLFSAFTKLTKLAIVNIALEANKNRPTSLEIISKARLWWDSMRPRTNCDHAAVAAARKVVKARQNKSRLEYDDAFEKRVQRSGLLDTARDVLSERALIFTNQDICQRCEEENDSSNDCQAVAVSAATYAYSDLSGLENVPANDATLDMPTVFVQLSELSAFIAVGDVLQLPFALVAGFMQNTEEIRKTGELNMWVQVLSVDLLLARIRAKVLYTGPPMCWTNSSQSGQSEVFWFPISIIWSILVARQDIVGNLLEATSNSNSTSNSDGRICKYLLFVTPNVSHCAALAALAALPRHCAHDKNAAYYCTKATKLSTSTPDNMTPTVQTDEEPHAESEKPKHKATGNNLSNPNAQAENNKCNVAVRPLDTFADAAIISWEVEPVECFLGPNKNSKSSPFQNRHLSAQRNRISRQKLLSELEAVVQLSKNVNNGMKQIAHHDCESEWFDVQRFEISANKTTAAISACQISGLVPLCQYRCRVLVEHRTENITELSEADMNVPRRGKSPATKQSVLKTKPKPLGLGYCAFTTLGLALSHPSVVLKWDTGPDHSRTLRCWLSVGDGVERSQLQLNKQHSSVELPVGCCYLVEYFDMPCYSEEQLEQILINNSNDETDMKSNKRSEDEETIIWKSAGCSRHATLCAAGPWLGWARVLFRTMIVNQASCRSKASPVTIAIVPNWLQTQTALP